VNRIFEGTNEINRLLIPGMLMRRALKGELPILKAAKAIQNELLPPPAMGARAAGGSLAEEQAAVAGFKKAALAVMGVGMLKFGEKLADEQEVMMSTADMIMEVFQAESAVLRAMAAQAAGVPNAALHEDATRVFVNDAAGRVEAGAKQALAAMADGDMLRTHVAALRRLLKWTPVNTVAMRRRLADATVAKGAYLFR
jgi:alkylation response protein AidB-like acyl-CoA dehydrogenase